MTFMVEVIKEGGPLSPVHEFRPHAGLAAEHEMRGIGRADEVERIAIVVLGPVAAAGDVIQVPTRGQQDRMTGRRRHLQLLLPTR